MFPFHFCPLVGLTGVTQRELTAFSFSPIFLETLKIDKFLSRLKNKCWREITLSYLYVCVCAHVHVCARLCIHEPVWAYGSWRPSGAFLHCPPPQPLTQVFSLNLELTGPAGLTGQWTPRIFASSVLVTDACYHMLLFLHGCWQSKFGSSCLCTTLLTESSPQPWLCQPFGACQLLMIFWCHFIETLTTGSYATLSHHLPPLPRPGRDRRNKTQGKALTLTWLTSKVLALWSLLGSLNSIRKGGLFRLQPPRDAPLLVDLLAKSRTSGLCDNLQWGQNESYNQTLT